MFIVELFMMVTRWIYYKLWYIYIQRSITQVLKKKIELLEATTLMNLESIKWKKPPMKWQRMYGLFCQEYPEEVTPQRQNAVCKVRGEGEVGTRE